MNWFLTIFRGTSPTTRESTRKIVVGSRVKTELGNGSVTQGSVTIKYDDNTLFSAKAQRAGVNNRTWTHNINDVKLED